MNENQERESSYGKWRRRRRDPEQREHYHSKTLAPILSYDNTKQSERHSEHGGCGNWCARCQSAARVNKTNPSRIIKPFNLRDKGFACGKFKNENYWGQLN